MKTVLKYSAGLTAASIAYFILMNIVGLSGNNTAGWLGYVPYAVFVYLIQNQIKRQQDGSLSFAQGWLYATIVCVVAAVLSSLFMFSYVSLISDEMIVRTIEELTQSYIDSGMTGLILAEKIEAAEKIVTPKFFLIFGSLAGTVIGVLVSAISAFFMRSKPATMDALVLST